MRCTIFTDSCQVSKEGGALHTHPIPNIDSKCKRLKTLSSYIYCLERERERVSSKRWVSTVSHDLVDVNNSIQARGFLWILEMMFVCVKCRYKKVRGLVCQYQSACTLLGPIP